MYDWRPRCFCDFIRASHYLYSEVFYRDLLNTESVGFGIEMVFDL